MQKYKKKKGDKQKEDIYIVVGKRSRSTSATIFWPDVTTNMTY